MNIFHFYVVYYDNIPIAKQYKLDFRSCKRKKRNKYIIIYNIKDANLQCTFQ